MNSSLLALDRISKELRQEVARMKCVCNAEPLSVASEEIELFMDLWQELHRLENYMGEMCVELTAHLVQRAEAEKAVSARGPSAPAEKPLATRPPGASIPGPDLHRGQ